MQQPFGYFALSALRNVLRHKSGRIRNRAKFLSTVLRKASMFGIAEPYDVEPAEGFKVRLYPSNNATDKNTYMGLEITDTPHILAINQAACRCSGSTFHFVDIGGNSGMFTIAAARAASLAEKKLFVVAIEANDAMAERLRFNLEASGVKNPHIYDNAVSNKNEKVFLSLANKNLGQATVVSDFVAGETISVQARLLKELLDEANMPRIDFLKIDIEGHEHAALTPFFESENISRYPTTILTEVSHDPDLKVAALLERHNYCLVQKLSGDAIYERIL